MVEIKISDNGGETFDRYVVVIDDNVYTMSRNPQQPNGYNQYAGETQDFDSFETENEVALNDEVLRAILERI